jgi:hypothetical protein
VLPWRRRKRTIGSLEKCQGYRAFVIGPTDKLLPFTSSTRRTMAMPWRKRCNSRTSFTMELWRGSRKVVDVIARDS